MQPVSGTMRTEHGGTGEFAGWDYGFGYETIFVRNDPDMKTVGLADETYRTCLESYGLDSPMCEQWLRDRFADESAQYTIKSDVLGDKASALGMCAGIGLRSDLCQSFCADERSSKLRICETPLLEHCKEQTAAFGHESVCACWLPPQVYVDMQTATTNEGLKSLPAKQAEEIQRVLTAGTTPVHCWYGPCTVSRVRPTTVCGDKTILTCIQEMSNNILESKGNQALTQSCNFNVNDNGTVTSNGQPPVVPPSPSLFPGVDNRTVAIVVIVVIAVLVLLIVALK